MQAESLAVLVCSPGAARCLPLPCRLSALLPFPPGNPLEGGVVVFCWVVTVSGGWDPAVDPGLCSPYQEPDRFWSLDESGLLRAGVPWGEGRRELVGVASFGGGRRRWPHSGAGSGRRFDRLNQPGRPKRCRRWAVIVVGLLLAGGQPGTGHRWGDIPRAAGRIRHCHH